MANRGRTWPCGASCRPPRSAGAGARNDDVGRVRKITRSPGREKGVVRTLNGSASGGVRGDCGGRACVLLGLRPIRSIEMKGVYLRRWCKLVPRPSWNWTRKCTSLTRLVLSSRA